MVDSGATEAESGSFGQGEGTGEGGGGSALVAGAACTSARALVGAVKGSVWERPESMYTTRRKEYLGMFGQPSTDRQGGG